MKILSPIKKICKKSKLICKLYYSIKKPQTEPITNTSFTLSRLEGEYIFENRKKDSEKLCLILAGYKPILWDNVFERLKAYLPQNIDVCIVSSGLYNKKLSSICKSNEWSYLSLTENKLTLALNIAINIHTNAQWIYKMDEDIFLTKDSFDILEKTYIDAQKKLPYEIGFVAPLIPINGYGYVRVLEKLNLKEVWNKQFNEAKFTNGFSHHFDILKNPEAAKFFWGECEPFRDIDAINDYFKSLPLDYSICSTRFSIGFILFKRELWDSIGMFEVHDNNNLGVDEYQLCVYCMDCARAIVVAENTVVGHLSYGPQNEEMLCFYQKYTDRFKLKH